MIKPSLSLQDSDRIYLDYNATTPPLHTIIAGLTEWANFWGNPSSIHKSGRSPKALIRDARQAMAEVLKVHPLELVFTSGGSESNNTIIKGLYLSGLTGGNAPERNEYITSTVEHPSVLKCFQELERWGARVHYVGVNRGGEIDLDQYEKLLSERVALVSIMAANNETGSLFPIKKMCRMAHQVGAKFHTDAVQALGKMPVDLRKWDVDFASFAGHKVYSLKGAGVAFFKRGERQTSLITGGGQERGRRAGTENVLAIAALGLAARQISEIISLNNISIRRLRDELEQRVRSEISGVYFTGDQVDRLPNTSSLVIDGIDGESLLMGLDLEGVSVSTGAACSSGNPEPSPVLLAMGLSRSEAQKSLRVSLGVDTTVEQMDSFVQKLIKVVMRLRDVNQYKINDKDSSDSKDV